MKRINLLKTRPEVQMPEIDLGSESVAKQLFINAKSFYFDCFLMFLLYVFLDY